MDFELTIIIPVYNEEDNLLRVQQELSGFMLHARKKAKVLFVNDGSKDNSQKIIEEICSNTDTFEFISFDKNYGLSAAIKAGFDTANTSWVGYIDADLQTDPMDFNILLEYADSYELESLLKDLKKENDDISKEIIKIQNILTRKYMNRAD